MKIASSNCELEEFDLDDLESLKTKNKTPKIRTGNRTTARTKKLPNLLDPYSEFGQQLLNPISQANLALCFKNFPLNLDTRISIDTETTGLRWRHGDRVWMVSMADQESNSWCALWAVNPFDRSPIYTKDSSYQYLQSIVEDDRISKRYFNGPFDVPMLNCMDIKHRGRLDEVSLAARSVNSDEIAYKLKYLSKKYCGLSDAEMTDLKVFINKIKRKINRLEWGGMPKWKVFSIEGNTNSKSKDDKAEPDYWLSMYAHIFLPEEEAQKCRALAEEYCRKDTLRTSVLADYYDKRLDADESRRHWYEFELDLTPLVKEMSDTGIYTYKDTAIAQREECIFVAEHTLKEIHEDFPGIKPNSPEDVARILFSPVPEGLGLPPTEITAKGQHKTGYKDLGGLAYHPMVQKIWKYKAHDKAVSLFFDKYIDNLFPIDEEDESKGYVLHAEINQGAARTWRFSMSNPNLQQAANPESSARGANVVGVRGAFGPRPGYVWVLKDFKGQEFRLTGDLMDIPEIIDAVRYGRDIPTELGNGAWGGRNNPAALMQTIDSAELLQLTPSTEEVAKFWKQIGWVPGSMKEGQYTLIAEQILEQFDYDIIKLEKYAGKKTVRTRTKMCLYGKIFGAGVNGVVGLLLCPPEDAKEWLNILDRRFPQMRKVGNQWAKEAQIQGFTTTAFGRKLNVDPEFAYKATNYKIQGSAADMMKISMKNVARYYKSTGLDARLVLTIHDELVSEIKKEHCYPWLLRGAKQCMETHPQLRVPMEVSFSIVRDGRKWDQEEELELTA